VRFRPEWDGCCAASVLRDGSSVQGVSRFLSPARGVLAGSVAFQNLGKVCRSGTHLFHFAEYVNAMRGRGRGLRNAVGRWYISREADDLALQAVKYQQRDGWSHGDLLRLAHPKAPSPLHDAVFRWMLPGADSLGERTVKRKVHGEDRVASYGAVGSLPRLIEAFEQAKKASSQDEIVKLITEHDLPRDAIPTQWLNEVAVWDALLQRMPMTAMIRNLGEMTTLGLVRPFSDAAKLIVRKLSDETVLKRACIHPLAVLIAEKVYAQGKGDKGGLTWKPVPKIIDALDAAFYATFQNVEPCGKPVLLALDVSGSMGCGSVAGPCLTPREASAAMASVTAATACRAAQAAACKAAIWCESSTGFHSVITVPINGLPHFFDSCPRLTVGNLVASTYGEKWRSNLALSRCSQPSSSGSSQSEVR